MTLSKLTESILKKAGADLTDKKFAELLTNQTPIMPEAYAAIEGVINSFMTEGEAVINQNVKKKIRHDAFDPMDKEQIKYLKEVMGYTDEEIKDVADEPNSYEKLKKTLGTIAKLEKAKAAAAPGDKQALTSKIADLQKSLDDTKASYETKLKDIESAADIRVSEFALNSVLKSLDYANDGYSKDESAMAFRPVLENALKTKGAKIIFNPATNDIDLIHADSGDPYHENHKPVKFTDLLATTAAAKKVLRVNPDPASPTEQGIKDQLKQIPGGDPMPKSNQNALSIIESRLTKMGEQSGNK